MTICNDCYEMNKNLLGVSVKPIVPEGDVQKGDIIRYSCWNLWHDAIVLDERKEIQQNGQCFKLDYDLPQYDVYEPEEVVRRARKRLGEQLFVCFFPMIPVTLLDGAS
uniref:LRAT domain-containing protein n=1 Tax=Magallana gigas TaxID=29159 RepID=A0A8W8K0J7_MAGGI